MPPPQDFMVPVPFPSNGVHVRAPYYEQPPLTCVTASNVRGYDAQARRLRGGQRPGLNRLIQQQFVGQGGYNWFQDLAQLSIAGASGGIFQRTTYGLAVVGGNIYRYDGGTQTFIATALIGYIPIIFSAPNGTRQYYVDSNNFVYFDGLTSATGAWVATAGSLPTDGGNAPRLIELWRGRTVLSGIITDAQNWFMSAVNDAANWDYAPATVVETQAVAGNNSSAGKVGDNIMTMIPWSDDVLIFGCDKSIYQMTGDPMAGGRIDRITSAIGMAYGRPWTMDQNQTVYFFSSRNSVYRMNIGGGAPERISYAIDPLLDNYNPANTVVKMAWDDRLQGLHLFLSHWKVVSNLPVQPPATTHFYWDSVNNAWWPDSYSSPFQDPLAVLAYEPDDPGSRRILLGGQDGYLRFSDDNSPSDDRGNIASSVTIGPIKGSAQEAFLLKEIQAVLDSNSVKVQVELLAGASAEIATASLPVYSNTWSPGRNISDLVRRNGTAFYLRLSATTGPWQTGSGGGSWQLESLLVKLRQIGKVRQRITVGRV